MQRSLSFLRRLAICLALAGLACWLTILVWPLSERFPFAFFLAAVVASAWSCGPGAAVFTTALCTGALGYIYYWQSPIDGLELVQENLPRLALFLFTGLLTSYLVRECRGAISAVDRVHLMLGHLGEALITTDSQGMVRYLNQEAQTLTGCEMREAVGKPLGHVLTLVDEQTRQPLQQPHHTVLARRVAVDLPAGAALQSARGKGFAVEGRAAPIQDGEQIDGVAITFRDVTRRRANEQSDRNRLEQWQRAAGALPDPVFIKDELGNYLGANAAAAQLVARDQNAIAGAEDAALFSPEVARTIIQADRAAFESGQPQRYQLAVGDGAEHRIFEAVKTPILGPAGKLSGLVDVFRDVTHVARDEEKLKRAARDFEQQLEEQADAHNDAVTCLRQNHEKECEALQAARQNSEDSWIQQVAELRRRFDEKTIEHAEAQALLEQLPEQHSKEYDNRLAAERVAARREFDAEIERLRTEHASHLQNTAQAEQARGENLLRLKEREHSMTLAELQSAWEWSEEALQQARTELEELRGRTTVDPEALVAARQELEQLRTEHASHLRDVAQAEQARGENLLHLKEREHSMTLAELQSAWESSEEALQQARKELGELRGRTTVDPEALAVIRQEREELIQRVAEQTAARLGLEDSLRRAQEQIQELHDRVAQPRELDADQAEEIRRLAAEEHERKANESVAEWQRRLELAAQEHDRHVQSAHQSWQQRLDLAAQDHDQRFKAAHQSWQQQLDQVAQKHDQHFQSARQDWQKQLDLAAREHDRHFQSAQQDWQRRLDAASQEHDQRFQSAQQEWQRRLDTAAQLPSQRLGEVEQNWQNRFDLAKQEHDRHFQSSQQSWQQRLDQAVREQEERFRSAQEGWRQTLGEYDRRLTEARNLGGENETLRDQLERSRSEALQARREKEQLEELLKNRHAAPTNGKSPVGLAAYEAWESRTEKPNPDWLSFN